MGLEVGLEIIISEVISRFQVTSYKGPSTSHSETARTPKGGRREKMERKGTVWCVHANSENYQALRKTAENVNLK